MASSTSPGSAPRTLYDKLWDAHIVAEDGQESILYIDLHMLHEVTSPQAFSRLAEMKRTVRRPDLTLAMADHCVPTTGQERGIPAIDDPLSRAQLDALNSNAAAAGIEHYSIGDRRNGIVHVVGPELGRTLPGMTVVCGDSHTSTHGAFGALAFGIGTSEIEHVLATQSLRQTKSKNMRVRVSGRMGAQLSAKDLALRIISDIGVDGATGHVIEYCGPTVESLSMEGRMTLCNMSIEAGARAGLVAPDETTFDYLASRISPGKWRAGREGWARLYSDAGACFDKQIEIDVSVMKPMVSWGINPAQSMAIDSIVPTPEQARSDRERRMIQRALDYMGLEAGQPLQGTPIDQVFIGSCTNGRIEDLRAAAEIARGRNVAASVSAMVVPGSGLVRAQAEAEGLDTVFRDAGMDWRQPGCSMCAAMNSDRLKPGQRCASTSNRNFENRQGPRGRTHLMSPAMAAAAAVTGTITDLYSI